MTATRTHISTDPADLFLRLQAEAGIRRGLADLAAGRCVGLDHLVDEEEDVD